MTEFLESVSELVDEATAELFPPKPGGLVDRHRQRIAERDAQIEEETNVEERIEERAYRAVKVAPESPEIVTPITYTIQAGASAQVLPHNPYRYRAIINLLTAASTVVLCKDQSAALGGNGYTIAAANPILSVFSRAQLWAYNNNGFSIQVSVFSEAYAPER